MTKLEAKKQAAIEAIKAVHADLSGEARDNLQAIREIIEEAKLLERALEDDCG